MNIFFSNKDAGFTLIEMLIVIALISVLSGTLISTIDPTRQIGKARDSTRISHMHAFINAISQYQIYHQGQFPPASPDKCCADWDQNPCDGDTTFINDLMVGEFLRQLLTDPKGGLGNSCYGYNYYLYESGSYGCNPSQGRFYVLGVRDMESSNGPYPNSPGWSCPGRNWQEEFDWVIGEFEK